MYNRVDCSDGYTYFPASQIYTELSSDWDETNDSYSGGSGGGGGTSRSWNDGGSSWSFTDSNGDSWGGDD